MMQQGRLSRLFLNQLLINSGFGILIGLGLWFIGIPSALLWGILAAVLRFVPYIGSIIAAAFPLALALAVDPGWSMLAWTAILFFIIEPGIGQVIEPMVYGRSTGLSPVAVVVSATFWTALWGPIGLILATPLTVCLVVLGRHVERLAFLDVMFGDRPALSPPEIFYQRMLAGDPAEAVEKAEEFLKEGTLASYYDDIALKGLRLAQDDLDREVLDVARLLKIRDTVGEFTDDLEGAEDVSGTDGPTEDAEAAAALQQTAQNSASRTLPVVTKLELLPEWRGDCPVLCISGRTELDEAAGLMFVGLCKSHGLMSRVKPASLLMANKLSVSDVSSSVVVCLSYLNVSSPSHMRFAIRRIRRRLPKAIVMLGCWSSNLEPTALEEFRERAKADIVVASLSEAVLRCIEIGRSQASDATTLRTSTEVVI